jgi:hypothetical protein
MPGVLSALMPRDARIATEDLCEILMSEHSALLARLLAETADAVAAQRVRASDLIIALPHHRKPDAGHRAVLESDACARLRLDAGVEHLAMTQRRVTRRGA